MNQKSLKYVSLTTLMLFLFIILSVIVSILGKISIETLLNAIQSEEVRFAILLSIKCSFIAIFLALIVGVPSAYALARYNFRGKEIIDSLINLPVLLPPLVSGFGLLIFFGNTTIGKFITENIVNIIFTQNGIIIAQFFIATPFIIRTTRAVFEGIDVKYEYIAQSLGSTKLESFLKITLPLAKSGIIAGTILGWARAIGEFGATLMLAGATKMKTETLPIAVFLNVSIGNIELALAIATIHIAIAVLVISLIKFVVNLEGGKYGEC
ncbi:ABC transporter permease [Methanotorris formicicus]|uniref:NifC-like ABC-type porter n=1 Tax=Methanotorris formicicus Mc-S-70 TaxID=647171 RepID=H1KY71_9EURY|nr:ABC transporter permease [Methanotorris formicicus]EHP87431.1 NifC-like ABC-type porter [Methanotorris formicicus Mc-S-70]